MTINRTASRFPAILIGGPPHAGKSVLAHSLRTRLEQNGLEFYLLRAAPDGEGDWYLEAEREVAEAERRKGKFTPAWVKRMCRDLAYRPLPFLVDAGGKPTPWQEDIFDQCSHAILLVKDAKTLAAWQAIVERHNLITLAVLTSRLEGESQLEAERPVLRGAISGLERGRQAEGPLFEALLQRVQALFSYPPDELVNIHWSQAPVDLVIDIPTMQRHLFPERPERRWQPADLPQVLDYLPNDEPLALYGRGPGWLYAAVAAHIAPQPFYQFDARLGWIAPVALIAKAQAESALTIKSDVTESYLHLKIELPGHYLDYDERMTLPLPDLLEERGVILDGKLPNWLYTGLTLFYSQAAWVALYAPHFDQAIVVAARQPAGPYQAGHMLALEK